MTIRSESFVLVTEIVLNTNPLVEREFWINLDDVRSIRPHTPTPTDPSRARLDFKTSSNGLLIKESVDELLGFGPA